MLENARRVLRDPVPAVRYQIVIRLLPLHDSDLPALWSILRGLAQTEKSTGVLSSALAAVINPMSGRYKSEVVGLLNTIMIRDDLPQDGGDAVKWCYRIATGLYLWQDDASAYALIQPVLQGNTFQPHRSAECLSDIREALTFSSEVPKEGDAAIRRRSFGLIETIIISASAQMEELLHSVSVEKGTEQWQENFHELARLIDFIGNQIYFIRCI